VSFVGAKPERWSRATREGRNLEKAKPERWSKATREGGNPEKAKPKQLEQRKKREASRSKRYQYKEKKSLQRRNR